jgi:hypothetical protein
MAAAPGRERLVYTIRTGGDGVQILHGGGNATYEVDGRQVKIYTSGGPGETLARSDGASERGCERKVAEHPGGDGRNRIVTIVCTRLRVNAAADALAGSTQRLETALARIEHEDKLGAEVKEQVESALREAIEQLRERR